MAASPEYDSTGIEYHNIPSFTFSSETTLHDLQVAYRKFAPSSSSASLGTVFIPTCYGGLINGTARFPAALSSYTVVVAAMLGNGESASPSNKKFFPRPGELRYSDVIRAHYDLLTNGLKVEKLAAVIGFSMGGQQSYHWGVMYPDFVERVVVICGSARTSPHNYAFLEGPLAALTRSMDYIAWQKMKEKVANGEEVGDAMREVRPKSGLRGFARAYAAWLTSAAWFREKHWAVQEVKTMWNGHASVEDWLKFREDGYQYWDADDVVILARMWQMGDIGAVIPGEESLRQLGGAESDDEMYKKALGSIKAKVLLMPCVTDQYFPPEDSKIEAQYLKNGTYAPIESVWGHIAGGGANPVDMDYMSDQIAKFMK